MRPAICKTADRLKDTRGAALVSVFLILMVLLILGMGILALATANTKQAKTSDIYERAYYVADGSAKQGIEVLKSAALEKYRLIAAEMADNIETNNTAESYFAYIDTVAGAYAPAQPDGTAGGPGSVTVKITYTVVNSTTRVYTVVSTAKGGSTERSVTGSITIKFVPVVKSAAAFTPLGNETLLCGGTLRQNGGWSEVWGTARFGAFSSYNPSQFRLNNTTMSVATDPNTKNALNWSMKYPGFTSSVRTPTAQLSLPAIANGTAITNAAFKDPPYNWTVPSPIYLEGQSGASFTISSFQYKRGQVYCTGSLAFNNDVLGTSSSYVNIYCSGNLSFSSGAIKYAKIYCGGNLTINGGGGLDNVTIYCNGTISDSCTNRTNVRVYCNSYTMNGGNFIGDNIVYAENSIHLESTVSGLFYTNGTVTLDSGSGLTGQIAAKGNFTIGASFNFKPDSAMLARLYADPFVTSSPGSGSAGATIIQPRDSAIFTTTPVFKEQ